MCIGSSSYFDLTLPIILSILSIALALAYTLSKQQRIKISVARIKLLKILAVISIVLMVISFGVTVFQYVWSLTTGMCCISNPIDEMVMKIKKAQSGITTSTSVICMYANEYVNTTSLTNKVSNLNTLTFKCDGAAVCRDGKPINVDPNTLTAVSSAQFKGIVDCAESSDKYDCTITIKSA